MALLSSPALACGAQTDCAVGERSYRIQMPSGHDGETRIGAIVHAHGYKGTARGVMANKALARMTDTLGVALIAAQTVGDDWVIPNAPRKRDAEGVAEFEYFAALADDAAARFPIDRARMMMSGFSAGGMMVWTLACHRSGTFAAYAPVAGTFWAPVPDGCPSPRPPLIHMHGTSDRVVPLEGRPIADTHQGKVRNALTLFGWQIATEASGEPQDGDLACESRGAGTAPVLELCLHPGGHALKPDWLARAWRRFEAAGAL